MGSRFSISAHSEDENSFLSRIEAERERWVRIRYARHACTLLAECKMYGQFCLGYNQITYLMPFMALLLACENAGTLLAAPKFISTQAIPNLFK